MKAVAIQPGSALSDAGAFADIELPEPTPGPRDLKVEVRAVALNPVDTKVRRNRKGNGRQVLGYDAAGVVAAVGSDVTLFRPGDEVFYAGDITRPGSNQQLQLVDERIVGHKPKSLDFAHAAALPLTAITAWEALFERLGFAQRAEGSLLIVGGAGGVGSIAIQLAKQAGLTVIATASRPESTAWVRQLGADQVVDHRKPLRAQLQGEVDAVAIFSETEPYFVQLPEVLRPQGRAVSIVETAGPLDLGPLKNKSLSFSWEFMFTRSSYQTADMIEQHHLLNHVAELVDAGTLRTTVTEQLAPISAATVRRAHTAIESGRAIGKLVIAGWG
jgi:zinc-binding alcohol dehydrogenase family protein